jgi:PAS domain S-box-containing protein
MPSLEPDAEHSELEGLLNSVRPGAVMDAIFGSTPSGAIIARAPDGMILRVSDFAARILGRPKSDIVGHTLADDFGPTQVFDPTGRYLPATERPLGRALRGETVMAFELVVETPSGERIPLLSSAAPIRDAHGAMIGAISSVTDVRPLKYLELSLRESEQQFRDLANSISPFVWVTDETGAASWFNRRWYEYTGMSPEAPMGWGWLEVVHPDHVDRVVERARHSIETGEPFEVTFPLRAADGRYRWFLARALAVRDPEGKVTRYFGTTTDVNEQHEAQELLRTLLKEVTHRVKNSLALVSSLLKLQAKTLEGDARRALEEASLRVHAVASVHDQLWRNAESREIDLKPFLSDLCSSIAKTAPMYKTVCRIEPAVVDSDLAVPVGLFVNELLTNAYKYAYPEGQKGEVRLLGTPEPGGRYRLEISDSGRGLPADFDLAKVGSLGMRVVTTLVSQLDGKLTVGSAEPGARFSLVFPLSTPTPETYG